ncbi:hypothetical protein BUALT_Bualt11G0028600 [Buddleja alternifolia]|uniref:Uncharacterized protein n=1 Tax=Buddleja alternifolia TaxID=168488 RepID=A0AAV6X2Q9_9LAMI|nr:hypothetical protein BUALT_Bualt11G0028600 [Buddleja alternifolia]
MSNIIIIHKQLSNFRPPLGGILLVPPVVDNQLIMDFLNQYEKILGQLINAAKCSLTWCGNSKLGDLVDPQTAGFNLVSYFINNGQWDIPEFNRRVPPHPVNQIVNTPIYNSPTYTMIWKLSAHCNFLTQIDWDHIRDKIALVLLCLFINMSNSLGSDSQNYNDPVNLLEPDAMAMAESSLSLPSIEASFSATQFV